MSPDAVDGLDDEVWAGMIRQIERHAAAVAAQNAKLPKL
jgi:hypothetical protein